MKNKILLSLLTIGLLTSCKTGGNNKSPTLESIELSGDYQTVFVLNEDFNYNGLEVIAHYSNQSFKTVSNYQVSNPDMSVLGDQDVIVTYKKISATYTIHIYTEEEVPYPVSDAVSFLLSRGVNASSSTIPSPIANLSGVKSSEIIEDDECPHFQVEVMVANPTEVSLAIKEQLEELQYDVSGDIFVDNNEIVGLEIYINDGNLVINLYSYNDLIDVPPEDDDGEIRNLDFPLQNSGYIAKDLNLNGHTYTFNDFTFAFSTATGSVTPKSEKSDCVYLYTNNTMTISSKYEMKKIAFTLKSETSYTGPVTSDVGNIYNHVWTGNNKSVTFTAVTQYRFININIEYVYKEGPVIEGVKTIKEVLDFAKEIEYTPSASGWYLTNNEVTIEVKAIDAIDSVTTSGLPANARGKVLCVDNTGYIIVSSGVNKSNPIDFYQRVKNYIKEGTTTYVVTGKIAFLNDVIEINVTSYQYDSSLEIEYDLNDYITSNISSSDSFMNHCKTIKTNNDGYGVGEVISIKGLTYFNKYNSSGSYYFLDRNSKLLPIYSLLDKDRSSLQLGKVYDIIGLESLYKGRPSLRILEVKYNDELEPVSFDFSNAVEKTETTYFYNVNRDYSAYLDEYYQSVTTIYKMDVYVSTYGKDKYTFNQNYHYDYSYKEYTTGSTQTNAASHNSLGIFNEDLDYKQTLLDFVINSCNDEDEVKEKKLTLYFTLAFLDTVSGKKMWRVNIFEDLVFSIDYYNSKKESISLNSVDSTWTHDDSKQVFQIGYLKVTNASTSISDYGYDPSYLKIYDGTSLEIEFNKPIIGFTIYHATYSYIAGLGSLELKAYRQFKDYTVVLLNETTNRVVIDDFAVGGNRNHAYLRVDSIQVNYLEA